MRHYPFFDPTLTRSLSGMQLRPRQAVDGQVVGRHQSRHRGFSVEFAQHRAYSPGDDLRYLDWKVYGRTDKRYVRQFEDEREWACYLVLDTSGSMAYRTVRAGPSKLHWARTPAALLAWLALRQRDAIGLVTFDQTLRWCCPASSHPSQLDRILSQLDRLRPEGRTDAGRALKTLAARLPRRGLIVVISDLWYDLDRLFAGITRLLAARNEVWILQVLDRAELEFPFTGEVLFRGLEREEPVLADAGDLRDAYRSAVQQTLGRIGALCGHRGIRYRRVTTDVDYGTALRTLVGESRAVAQ